MAMRRPRIKATALLTSKRKSRDAKTEKSAAKPDGSAAATENDEEKSNAQPNQEAVVAQTEITAPKGTEETVTPLEDNQPDDDGNDVFLSSDQVKEQPATKSPTHDAAEVAYKVTTTAPITVEQQVSTLVPDAECDDSPSTERVEVDNSSFKCPARVEYSRNYSQMPSHHSDDSFHTDIEDNVLQSDLQKGANGFPMSPSRAQVRQRIRPVPVFQRRNSFIGPTTLSQTAEDIIAGPTEVPAPPTHRRERHHSASISQTPVSATSASSHHHYAPHKFTPSMGLGRIRTESSCSAFSDSYVVPSKLRKTDEHSHRSYSRRDYEARFTNGAPDKSTLKMFDLIYYNPATNPMEQKPAVSTVKKESKPLAQETKLESQAELDAAANVMPVPQLKLNSNGELILDDTSLEIETTAEQEARKVLANSSLIFLDENTGMNGFYKRQKRTKEWPPEETIKFYRCLQTVGTDFSLMCQLFPKRTRRDLKLKFKKEERQNLALINKALLYPKTFNIDELKQQLDTEEREREEAEARWKEIKAKEAKSIKKLNIKTSVAARSLKHGDDIYQNENVVKRKLSKRANNTADPKKRNDAIKKPPAVPADSLPLLPVKPAKRKESKQKTQSNAECVKVEIAVGNNSCSSNINTNTNPTDVRIKVENIKSEQHLASGRNDDTAAPTTDTLQLEDDLIELLEVDAADDQVDELEFISNADKMLPPCSEASQPKYEATKTLVDLDDGTVNVVSDSDTRSLGTDVAEASSQRRELDEGDIERILMELAEGSLVLVSTLDPDNADKVVNEIYMLDKATGELCDTPLDIPEAIVQGILSVMS